jgi:Fungal chitosanase of glycosyl hydrolase group 75
MTRAFMQPDGNAPTKMTSVWSDADGSALLFIESLNVNTDGTRRSYSIEDFGGHKSALNNLCNAMTDHCAVLKDAALRERIAITQKAHAAGWPADLLKQTRIGSNMIPFKDGKPCPLVDGFLVSATALRKPRVADVCDIGNYVDALTVPALVLPGNPPKGVSGFAQRGASLGALAVAMVPGEKNPVFAVVGDIGPAGELGEASLALNGKLLGKTAEPQNYDEVRGRGVFKGRGWVVPRAIVLVFPKSGDAKDPFMTVDRIDQESKRRFEQWGGVARLHACAKAYAEQ